MMVHAQRQPIPSLHTLVYSHAGADELEAKITDIASIQKNAAVGCDDGSSPFPCRIG